MRRFLVFVLIALAPAAGTALAAGAESDSAAQEPAPTTTIDNSFLDTQRDLSECLNNSLELPGCGRVPTEAGDRGGSLQLATFGLLSAAIVFICWRVVKGVRTRDANLAATVPGGDGPGTVSGRDTR